MVVVVLVALGIFFAFQQGGSSGNATSTTEGLPPVSTSTTSTTPTVVPTSTTLTLGTNQGNVIMNNFYKTGDYITQDQQTVIVHNDPQYSIEYNVGDSSFSIGILSVPLEAARQAAEAAFLSRLGISEQDACKLNVYEGVPAGVSDKYVAQNFRLSFCGDATPL